MALNTIWLVFVIFALGLNLLVCSQNGSADGKHQVKHISRFFKTVAKIITKHGINIGNTGSDLLELKEDPKQIYKCGEKLLKNIEQLNRKNRTRLTNQDLDQIEGGFCSLISWVSMCNTYDLWTGEFGGGSICAAILKTSGIEPLKILGAKDNDPIRNITY